MASTADNTIVAVFQDSSTAQSAADQLRSAGIASDRLFVASQGSAPGAGYSESATSGTRHEGGIVGWFKSLFSDEETGDRARYESAVAGGRTIVSVDAQASDVDRVSDILDRYSPIDIHTEESMAHGVATFNTGNAGYQGSPSDILNAQDELSGTANTAAGNRAAQTGVQRGGVRVYPRINTR